MEVELTRRVFTKTGPQALYDKFQLSIDISVRGTRSYLGRLVF